MTNADPYDHRLFWSKSLAEELQRFLLSRLHCPEAAADLTQEIYLRLDRKYKEGLHDNARALAFRIALNLAIDYQRKAKLRGRFSGPLEQNDLLSTIPDLAVSIDRTLIAEEQLAELRQALAELPVDCRTAFHLHGVEGLSYSEIAERMHISKSMVCKLMAQAMTHCATRIDL